jgi:hypothetical protein
MRDWAGQRRRLSRKSSLIEEEADDTAELTAHLADHLDSLAGRR